MSRSSLTRYAPLMRDPDPNGAHRLAKRQFHETGAITFLPDQLARMPWQDREIVNRLASKEYGPRQETKRNG
jgi:hypothetical protein